MESDAPPMEDIDPPQLPAAPAEELAAASSLPSAAKKRKRDEGPPRRGSPSSPPPPNPRRYFALWEEEGRRTRPRGTCVGKVEEVAGDGEKLGSAANKRSVGVVARRGGTWSNEGGGPPCVDNKEEQDNLRTWEDELALARHNGRVRDKIQDCHRRAREHQRAAEEHQRRARECLVRAAEWEDRERRRIMVLPRLALRDDDHRFWNHGLSRGIKCSRELAWALLRADATLPVAFQQMLWMDPTCPLRRERQILLESIDRGLDQWNVQIKWSQRLANDRELVLKCFEKCPGCLSKRGDEPDLLKPYLKDMGALRAFALAPDPCEYRTSGYAKWVNGIHTQFSRTLFKDPDFMADLFVHLCRRTGNENWARSRLRRTFPQLAWSSGDSAQNVAPTSKTSAALLDNADFANRVADGLARLPPKDRSLCPVTYATLTLRVKKNPKVFLAFAKVDAEGVVESAPPSWSRDAEVWNDLWTAATEYHPEAIYHDSLKAAPCKKLLASKELVLRLLETTRTSGYMDQLHRLEKFAKFYPNFSSAIQLDRDINLQLVALWGNARRVFHSPTKLSALVSPRWIECRDFWTDLAANLQCPCTAWRLVPEKLANDVGLVRLWARRASPSPPDGVIDWLARTVASFPCLGLLSDREVLMNWLPKLCCDHPTAVALMRQVPQECLEESSLWIELFRKLDPPCNLLLYIPENIRNDPDVVDAQLRCSAKDDKVLAICFGALSTKLRRLFLPRIVQAIQNSDESSFDRTWRRVSHKYKLYRNKEAARAILTKGGDFDCHEFWGLSWRNDPEFLISVADVIATHPRKGIFWECCSDSLRRDKAFLLKVLKGRNVPELVLDDDLKRDFDIQFALYLRCSAKQIRESLFGDDNVEGVRFARQFRDRLHSYVSLEAFMAGVQSNAPSGPVSLLGRDDDTVIDFKRRLVEYLGCPSSRDEASDLRIVSNKLTLSGY